MDSALYDHSPQEPYERLLTKQDLSAVLRRTTRQIDTDVQRGLPFLWVGRRKRFRLPEVLDWYGRHAG